MLGKIFNSVFNSGTQLIALDDARIPANSLIYAIGDIHGRADLLTIILGQINDDLRRYETRDKYLIFLGDYVDRGMQSRQVIEIIIDLEIANTNFVFLRGNHEAAMISFIKDPVNSSGWLQFGGAETLLSYNVSLPPGIPGIQTLRDTAESLRKALPESHWNFLNCLQNYYTIGDYMFVHAGVDPTRQLSQQSEHDLLWIRDAFMSHTGLYEKIIVHGHTIRNNVEFMPNRISLDTGAYYSDQLSCLVLEGETRRVISTAHKDSTH